MQNIDKRLSELESKATGANRSEFARFVRERIPGWRGTTKQAFLKFLELNHPDYEPEK